MTSVSTTSAKLNNSMNTQKDQQLLDHTLLFVVYSSSDCILHRIHWRRKTDYANAIHTDMYIPHHTEPVVPL